MLEQILRTPSRISTTAAEVSSQELSIPKMYMMFSFLKEFLPTVNKAINLRRNLGKSFRPPFLGEAAKSLSFGVFFLQLCEAKCAFLLCAYMVKEKSVQKILCFLDGCSFGLQ